MSVCIVEDAPEARFHLAVRLELEGFPVVGTFQTFEDALLGILRRSPRFAIVGEQLHGERGINLCRELRRSSPDMLTILWIANSETIGRGEVVSSGVSAVVDRTHDLDELFRTMRKLI